MFKNKSCSSSKSCNKPCSGDNKGFSLVELMVVVAIMAILAVAGLAGFMTAQRRSRDSARKGDVRSIVTTIMASATAGNYTYPEIFNSDSLPSDPSGNYQYVVLAPSGANAGLEYKPGQDEIKTAAAQANFTATTDGTTALLTGNSAINGGFVCSIMESNTGGNASLTNGDDNIVTPFLSSGGEANYDNVYNLLTGENGPIEVEDQRTMSYSVKACTQDCNVFCMTY